MTDITWQMLEEANIKAQAEGMAALDLIYQDLKQHGWVQQPRITLFSRRWVVHQSDGNHIYKDTQAALEMAVEADFAMSLKPRENTL